MLLDILNIYMVVCQKRQKNIGTNKQKSRCYLYPCITILESITRRHTLNVKQQKSRLQLEKPSTTITCHTIHVQLSILETMQTEKKTKKNNHSANSNNNNNNNKYSIYLRHISSNKTIQRRITLYMNIQIT